jgi:hypothetical protein
MSDNRSLGDRLGEELTDDLSVGIVAVLLGVVGLFAFERVTGLAGSGLLLVINIAVFVPYAYDRHWPVEYARGAAVVWTVSAALVTAGLFIGVFQFAVPVAGEYAPGIAFVTTVAIQYATAALFGRVRRRA